MTGPFKGIDHNIWRECDARNYRSGRWWNDLDHNIRFPVELRRWRRGVNVNGSIVQTGDAEYRIIVCDIIPTSAAHRAPFRDAGNGYSSFIAAQEAADYLMESPAPFRELLGEGWREYNHSVYARRTPEQNLLVVYPALTWRLYDDTLPESSLLPCPSWSGWGRGDSLEAAMRQADASNLTHWRAPDKNKDVNHMSYGLVPASRRIETFSVNSLAWQVLVSCCRDLCGEAFASIRIQPPRGKSDDAYPDHLRSWYINNRQRVSAADAEALGNRLCEAIGRGEAEECVRRQYQRAAEGYMPAPLVSPDPEAQVRKLRKMLADFAEFLKICGGFAIW